MANARVTEKHQRPLEVGQHVRVHAKSTSPWSSHAPGEYEGEIVGLHEQGIHVQCGDVRVVPWVDDEVELVDAPSSKSTGKRKADKD